MLVNCLNLQYRVISTSFGTNRQALLALSLQMAKQIKFDGNLIQFALLNLFTYQIDLNQSFPALLSRQLITLALTTKNMQTKLYIHQKYKRQTEKNCPR